MKEKIKQLSGVQWTLLVVIAIALSISLGYGLSYIDSMNYIEPWANASNVSSHIAIDKFSGSYNSDTVFLDQRLSALTAILFYMLLGPLLLILFGYESISNRSEEEKKNIFLAFKTGIVITLMGLIPLLAEAAIIRIVQGNTREMAAQSRTKDELRQNLALLAVESYQHLVLPERLEGGGGSFEGLKIDDLPSYKGLTEGTYRFEETDSDTVLKITGSDRTDYPVENEGPEMQLSVTVMPTEITNWN